jgi:hypothetical protein
MVLNVTSCNIALVQILCGNLDVVSMFQVASTKVQLFCFDTPFCLGV